MESSGLGADNAALGVAAALDVSNCHVSDRTVALNDAGDASNL